MTLETFLEKLEQTPRDWRIDTKNRIRRGLGGACQCPVSAIGGRSVQFYAQVASRYELRDSVRINIVGAADSLPFTKSQAALRAKLLKACRLESA